MSWLRRSVLSLLALSVVMMGFVIPAQTANAVTPAARIMVWGDSMSLAWPAFLQPLVGIPVVPMGVGGEDVQQTEARFNQWFQDNQAQRTDTVHLCWCGHVNNNPEHVGTAKDIDSVIPTLRRMADQVPGLFQPIGLENGPDAPQGSAGYNLLINSPPYGTPTNPDLSGNAINEQMKGVFRNSYAEVRHYLVTDGLRVANLLPGTATDQANIAVDVPPESLRRASSPSDPHLSNAGKQVTAARLNELLREDGLIPPSQGLATTTTASSTINPSTYGQVIQFTATVRATGGGTLDGSVQFFVNGSPKLDPVPVPPSGEVVSSRTGGLLAGQNVIQAVYSSSTATFASSSGSFTQVVNGGGTQKLDTSTTVTSSMNPVVKGTRVRFSATVADASGQGGTVKPTGTVQFSLDGNLLGRARTVNTSGVALTPLVQLSVGTHTITAVYSGNTKYTGSTGGPFTQTVTTTGGGGGGTFASSTTITSTQASAPYGTKVQFTATVADASGQGGTVKPTGTVQFYLDGNAYGGPYTLNTAGRAITPYVQLARGPHTITSVYSGDSRYNPSNGGPYTQTVT